MHAKLKVPLRVYVFSIRPLHENDEIITIDVKTVFDSSHESFSHSKVDDGIA
jgi:hypothetical protein